MNKLWRVDVDGRFLARHFYEEECTQIFDMESGACVITVDENHDWCWVDKVEPEWSDEKYVTEIAKVIVDALNKANIPKPKLNGEVDSNG